MNIWMLSQRLLNLDKQIGLKSRIYSSFLTSSRIYEAVQLRYQLEKVLISLLVLFHTRDEKRHSTDFLL